MNSQEQEELENNNRLAKDLRSKLILLAKSCNELVSYINASVEKDSNYMEVLKEKIRAVNQSSSEMANYFTIKIMDLEKFTSLMARLAESLDLLSKNKDVQEKILESVKAKIENEKNTWAEEEKVKKDELSRLVAAAKLENESAANLKNVIQEKDLELSRKLEELSEFRRKMQDKFNKIVSIIGTNQ